MFCDLIAFVFFFLNKKKPQLQYVQFDGLDLCETPSHSVAPGHQEKKPLKLLTFYLSLTHQAQYRYLAHLDQPRK